MTMKKLLFFSIIFIFIFLFGISAFAVSEGDYIVAGEYNGSPLLWRCVSVSDEGVYVISDKVLMTRSFSSDGNNHWETSDIRAYLNGEFYENCLKNESQYILSANVKTISATDDNSTQHIYNNNYTSSIQNAADAYTVATTDKVFLPSLTEIQPLYTNIGGFGPDFYMGKDGGGNYLDYYLRDALSFAGTRYVRCVSSQMDIYYSTSTKTYYDRLIRFASADNGDIGIRPAILLSNEAPFINGDGTQSDPYEVPGGVYCEITLEKYVGNQGDYYVPDISYALSEEGQYIKYYCNNREYAIDESCCLGYGENYLYAVIYDINGNKVYVSETECLYGVFKDPGTTLLFDDFESGNPYYDQFQSGHGVVEGDSIGIETLVDGNNVLKFDAHSASTFMNSRTFNNYRDTLIFETNFMLCDWNFSSRAVLYISAYKGATKQWLTPVTVRSSDKAMLFDVGDTNVVVKSGVELNTWYKISIVYDVPANKSTFYLNDEPLIYNADTAYEFDYISYLNISYSTPDVNSVMYFDDIGVYHSRQDMSGTRFGEPYYTVKNIKTYDFSTSNTSFSFAYANTENTYAETIELTDDHGKVAHIKTSNNDSKAWISSPGRSVFSNAPQSSFGAMVFEFEFNVLENGGTNTLLGAISYRNPANKEITWCVLNFNNDGNLYIAKDIDYGANDIHSSVLVKEFKKNKWHKVRYVIDTEKLLIYIYFDGKLYSEVDCGRSRYTGDKSKLFSTEYSRKSCYLEIQAMAPGAGRVNEIYVDNISHKYTSSPIVYNLEYINNLEVIVKRSEITGTDSLNVTFDAVRGDESNVICVASVLENNGELVCVATKNLTFSGSDSVKEVELELSNLPIGIAQGGYTVNVMVWNADNQKPLVSKIVLPD